MLFDQPFGGVVPGARGAVLAALLRTDTPLTGRQIHGLVSDQHSLWTVQEALKALAQIGVVSMRIVGRAGIHTINEGHYTVAPLRALVDPIGALTETVRETVGEEVKAAILFGSVARGEARPGSDIDLAVLASSEWDGRVRLEDAVRTRLGNNCDVLAFTPARFTRLARAGEPVVAKILAEGIPLHGSVPRATRGAA